MSATGIKDSRIAMDDYPTPPWCVRALAREVPLAPIASHSKWLEPSAGSGSIIRTVGGDRSAWHAVEINKGYENDLSDCAKSVYICDFMDFVGGEYEYDTVIGNPPYSLAMEFVQKSIYISRRTIFLLRLNFLGTAKRAIFLRDHIPDVYVLPNRPSFTGSGTDSIEYAWFVWYREDKGHRSHGLITVLEPLAKEQRK